MNKERLVAFTDAVLAIIMTILILELEKPSSPTIEAFWELRRNFLAYFISFFWLGSLWMGLNWIWEKVDKISNSVIWWNLILLFASSFVPYTTGLVSQYYYSKTLQGFYGIVVILTTTANWFLHKAIDKPNEGNSLLLRITAEYRKLLIPDIAIKAVGLILAVTVFPPMMGYSVLVAAAYIIVLKHMYEKKIKTTDQHNK